VSQLVLHLLSESEVVVMNINDYYLPLDALKKVLVGTIFVEDNCNYEEMMISIIRGIIASGHHDDAIKWGFTQGDGLICIYKQVPLLDLFGHLHSC